MSSGPATSGPAGLLRPPSRGPSERARGSWEDEGLSSASRGPVKAKKRIRANLKTDGRGKKSLFNEIILGESQIPIYLSFNSHSIIN